MLVLHLCKVSCLCRCIVQRLGSADISVLALGVAPMQVVSRLCCCIVQRLCATDCKRPCLVGRQPHIQPGTDAGRVCPKALHDAEPTKQTQPFTGERGLGIGIINQKFISKTDFFYKLYPRLLMQSGVNIKCDDYLYLPFWIFFINCRFDISPVLTFQESSCSSFQLL